MQLLDCAIIIVNWNSWEYLFPCLDAVSQQTYQGFRVIVIDNASSDRSPASKLDRYSRLTFVQNSENVGFAKANNQAIRLAEDCEWIVLLNPDTVPVKDSLECLCKAAENYPDYSFFGSHLVMADNQQKLDGTGDVYHMSGLTWRSGHGLDVAMASSEPHEIFSPCAAAAMYRRKDLLAVGGFDEDFFCYNEDIDLGFRLRLAGHRALSVPDSVILHYGSGTTGKRSDFAVYYGHRNLVWTWVKDMPFVLLLFFFPVHFVYNLACIFLYTIRGQGRVIVRAKWDAVMGLSRVWGKRKEVYIADRVTLLNLWKVVNKSIWIGPDTKFSKK